MPVVLGDAARAGRRLKRRPCYRCYAGLVHLPSYRMFAGVRGTRCETSPHRQTCFHPGMLVAVSTNVVTCLWCLTTPETDDRSPCG